VDQVGGDAKRSGAAWRVRRGAAAAGQQFVFGAKNQLANRGRVGRRTVDRQVRLRLLPCQHSFSRFTDRFQDGCFSRCVLIDTDAQIDLQRIRVGAECFGEPENGVGRRRLDGFEHGWNFLV
jgi:hypothetical protein